MHSRAVANRFNYCNTKSANTDEKGGGEQWGKMLTSKFMRHFAHVKTPRRAVLYTVYGAIAESTMRSGPNANMCRQNIDKWMESTGFCRSTVFNAVQEMHEAGWLAKIYRKGRGGGHFVGLNDFIGAAPYPAEFDSLRPRTDRDSPIRHGVLSSPPRCTLQSTAKMDSSMKSRGSAFVSESFQNYNSEEKPTPELGAHEARPKPNVAVSSPLCAPHKTPHDSPKSSPNDLEHAKVYRMQQTAGSTEKPTAGPLGRIPSGEGLQLLLGDRGPRREKFEANLHAGHWRWPADEDDYIANRPDQTPWSVWQGALASLQAHWSNLDTAKARK